MAVVQTASGQSPETSGRTAALEIRWSGRNPSRTALSVQSPTGRRIVRRNWPYAARVDLPRRSGARSPSMLWCHQVYALPAARLDSSSKATIPVSNGLYLSAVVIFRFSRTFSRVTTFGFVSSALGTTIKDCVLEGPTLAMMHLDLPIF